MIPNTFYGYALTGAFDDTEHDWVLRYGGGYIATMKPRDSATFLSMSRQAGAPVHNGVGVPRCRPTPGPALTRPLPDFPPDTPKIPHVQGKDSPTPPLHPPPPP